MTMTTNLMYKPVLLKLGNADTWHWAKMIHTKPQEKHGKSSRIAHFIRPKNYFYIETNMDIPWNRMKNPFEILG